MDSSFPFETPNGYPPASPSMGLVRPQPEAEGEENTSQVGSKTHHTSESFPEQGMWLSDVPLNHNCAASQFDAVEPAVHGFMDPDLRQPRHSFHTCYNNGASQSHNSLNSFSPKEGGATDWNVSSDDGSESFTSISLPAAAMDGYFTTPASHDIMFPQSPRVQSYAAGMTEPSPRIVTTLQDITKSPPIAAIYSTPTPSKYLIKCSAARCCKTYNRPYDFYRHHNGAHAEECMKTMHWCPVKGCPRSQAHGNHPFPRRDKVKDHLRQGHGIFLDVASCPGTGPWAVHVG
ncbi:hypothetical protein IAQ61_011606 [Plenodomus lingam]|uniref:C2H2-type domain-containing protein n=1 Tax=Leptosphaeria maculans (strain JN3 / isolate v23.1.3 / race Av1-4-5-6-7-8) TaxID=985895 RepID=E5AAK9_LEPMJ|nr:hypothetical protein LEMA_P018300.1 [Plenodomus lingam JN3]KAH9859824.1 hypothetical protein IAQ61_011606 [Plenodomus lingam]CBY00700.1 hypothetical protein LEMA_P018300.1 [Plenodomus lingam JN3]